MRKLTILFAAVCGCVMALAQEIDAVSATQNGTTKWFRFGDQTQVHVTIDGTSVIFPEQTYDLTQGEVETAFGIAPTPPDEWVTVRENMTINTYGTLCWNNNLTAIEGAELYTISGKASDRIVLEQVNAEETKAGAGYVILATAETLRVKNGTNSVATPLTAAECNGLQGTFTEIIDGAAGTPSNVLEGNYIIYNNEWRLCGGYTGLQPNRAYMVMGDVLGDAIVTAPGRKYISMPLPKETPTGELRIENGEMRMNGKYIINGQLVIIKDNKMYNAQGMKL